MSHLEVLQRVILEQSDAIRKLAENLSHTCNDLVNYIVSFKGRIILTGIGKSGYIARKIAASFSSTGTSSFYIHPAEASHGDLGMITTSDLVIILSNSGETQELFDTINYCKRFAVKIAGITMRANSTLANNSDFLLLLPEIKEASSISAPTTSSLMMLSLGDGLTVAVQEAKGFTKEDFRFYHPGGKIGANLLKVKDLMHSKDKLPIVYESTSFAETIITMTQKSMGCATVVDENHKLIGIITDGDLRRHINEYATLKSASDLMSTNPRQISPYQLATEALFIMNSKKITVIPVTEAGILTGVVHIHDLLRAGVGG